MVKIDKFVGSSKTLNDLFKSVCVPNKTEYLNIHVFNMITGKSEWKILTKDISYECKCRSDGKNVIQINGGITMNVYECVKNIMYVKNIIFGVLLHVVAKMENIYQTLWMI